MPEDEMLSQNAGDSQRNSAPLRYLFRSRRGNMEPARPAAPPLAPEHVVRSLQAPFRSPSGPPPLAPWRRQTGLSRMLAPGKAAPRQRPQPLADGSPRPAAVPRLRGRWIVGTASSTARPSPWRDRHSTETLLRPISARKPERPGPTPSRPEAGPALPFAQVLVYLSIFELGERQSLLPSAVVAIEQYGILPAVDARVCAQYFPHRVRQVPPAVLGTYRYPPVFPSLQKHRPWKLGPRVRERNTYLWLLAHGCLARPSRSATAEQRPGTGRSRWGREGRSGRSAKFFASNSLRRLPARSGTSASAPGRRARSGLNPGDRGGHVGRTQRRPAGRECHLGSHRVEVRVPPISGRTKAASSNSPKAPAHPAAHGENLSLSQARAGGSRYAVEHGA
jgi:hypothetical protein